MFVFIFREAFLISEDLVIYDFRCYRIEYVSTLSIDFFVVYSLFSEVCEITPVEVEAITTRPHTVKTLLISGEIHSRVQRKLVKKDVAMQMFRDRVMCVGIDGGEMSKDEIVGGYRDWETDRKSVV